MVIVGSFVAAAQAFAKHIENPDAFITSTIAIASMILGLVGAVAAIASMPAMKYPEVSRWAFKAFIWLAKYLRERSCPYHWVSEALGAYLYFTLQLLRENSGPDRVLSANQIFICAFLYIPAWKYTWTFLSFTTPVFMLRALAHQDKIKFTQRKLGITMSGIKGRFKMRHTSAVFWLSASCLVAGIIAGNNHWFTNYIATPLIFIAISLPVVARIACFTLECRPALQTRTGRKFGALARLYLLSANPRK